MIYFLVALAMLTSCGQDATLDSTESGATNASQSTVPVTLSFFDVSMDDLVSPASSRADDEDGEATTDENASALKKANYFKKLSIAIFPLSGVGETQKFDQVNSDENFGKLAVNLPIGKFQLVAIAHKADDPVTIESPDLASFSGKKVSDMVYASMTLDITTSKHAFSCPMERSVAAFTLNSKDVSPERAAAVRATFKKHCNYQFDPSTSFVPSAQEYSSTISFSSDGVGKVRKMTFYTLLDQAEQDDVEILVEMLDTEGEVFNSFDFQHVKLAHKKRTTYTGNLFSGDAEMDFTTEITSADGFADSGGNVEF